MAYSRINWEDGEKISDGYVTINGQNYTTVEPVYQGQTATSADNLNIMDEGISNLYPKILFENAEGVENSVALNDNYQNYKRLKIYALADGGILPLIEIPTNQNKIKIDFIASDSGGVINYSKKYNIEGNNINVDSSVSVFINSSKVIEYIKTNQDYWRVKIVKVEGYKS